MPYFSEIYKSFFLRITNRVKELFLIIYSFMNITILEQIDFIIMCYFCKTKNFEIVYSVLNFSYCIFVVFKQCS